MTTAVRDNSASIGADDAIPEQELVIDSDSSGMHEVTPEKLSHIGVDGPEDLQVILWLKRAEKTRERLAHAG